MTQFRQSQPPFLFFSVEDKRSLYLQGSLCLKFITMKLHKKRKRKFLKIHHNTNANQPLYPSFYLRDNGSEVIHKFPIFSRDVTPVVIVVIAWTKLPVKCTSCAVLYAFPGGFRRYDTCHHYSPTKEKRGKYVEKNKESFLEPTKTTNFF